MPGEFDGYVTEATGGGFEAAARGRVLDVFETEAEARQAVLAAAGDRPSWRVGTDGSVEPLLP